MILSLVSQKGGVGKSTLAICLAWELMRQRYSVLIADADKQETCMDACIKATQENREGPVCMRFGEDLLRRLPIEAARFQQTIIDTPGRLDRVSRAALVLADVALVPIRPSAPDAWALEQTVTMIEEAEAARREEKRPPLRCAVVLTQVRRTKLHSKAGEALRGAGLPLFKSKTMNRTAWEWAIYKGMGVTEHEPHGKAAQELRAVLAELTRFQRSKT